MTIDRETSIRRGIDVLLSLASDEAIERGGLGVTRIAEELRREKSQVSRALKALAESGLVERNRDAMTYRLGWRIYALAQRAGRPRLLEDAQPLLDRLVHSLSERAYLSVLQGHETLTLLSDGPGRAVQAVGWVGRVTPAYCTSSGQALLLDHEPSELEALFAGVEFRPLGPNALPNVPALARKLAATRPLGYVVADEEFEEGLISVAAPVRDALGRITAALNVSAPKYRFAERIEGAAQEVVRAAAELSATLGAPDRESVAGAT
jgi:DNA-binding IclR family transcriptional regulator